MSQELTDFLKGMATDPDKFQSFVADPEAAMEAAGLTEEDKESLRTGQFTKYGAFPHFIVFEVQEYDGGS